MRLFASAQTSGPQSNLFFNVLIATVVAAGMAAIVLFWVHSTIVSIMMMFEG